MRAKVMAVIPARLGSKRFNGKVLHPYKGKPLLFYVWQAVAKSRLIERLIIASDNSKILYAAEQFGAEVMSTSSRHKTGSDRLAEVAEKIKASLYVNIQADCFGLKATVLDRTITKILHTPSIEYATLARKIIKETDLFNPHKVKLVCSPEGNALWFSRYPIPYLQHYDKGQRFRQFPFLEHIGIYFFRRKALRQFTDWTRSDLEKAESLEQLRILANNKQIMTYKTSMKTVSVDSPADLKRIKSLS